MANWASPAERFVEVPGVVDIRRKSDDPDFYEKPVDLFDHQAKNEGLPDSIGKKDPFTTLQTYFTCNVCECELKSVVTLRAHCRGTQHIRKSLQKKKEYKDKQKLLESTKDTTEKGERSSYGRDEIKGSSLGKDEKSWGREKNRTSDGEEKKEDYKRERHHSREGAARNNFRSRSREKERRYGKCDDRKADLENVKVDRFKGGVDRNIKYEDDKEIKRHDIKEEKDSRVSKEKYESKQNRQARDSNFGQETASSSNQPRNSEGNQLENQEKSADQEILLLHRKVADYVKKCLNEYWANIETTEPKNRKINDAKEYAKLAKSFSHQMRDQIKETYEQYHRTLEGIAITADNKLHIKATIEMEMDKLPVIKLEG